MASPVKIWRRQKHIPKLLGKRGKILSWTIIRTPPKGFKRYAPYVVALVELDNGQKIVAQITDVNLNKRAGYGKVAAALRKVCNPGREGIIEYGIKFKPCAQ